MGEIDLDKDDDAPVGYEKAEVEVVHRLSRERKSKENKKEKRRRALLLNEEGFEGEVLGENA